MRRPYDYLPGKHEICIPLQQISRTIDRVRVPLAVTPRTRRVYNLSIAQFILFVVPALGHAE